MSAEDQAAWDEAIDQLGFHARPGHDWIDTLNRLWRKNRFVMSMDGMLKLAEPPPSNEGWRPAYTAWQAFAVKVLVEGGRNQDSNLTRLYGYRERMPVFARTVVATTQPLAAQAGLHILRQGGGAVDARLAHRRHDGDAGHAEHDHHRAEHGEHLDRGEGAAGT